MTTLAEIVSTALTAVNTGITDVVLACRLYSTTNGAWNGTTGRYDTSVSAVGTQGTCVFDTSTPVEDVFPEGVPGPSDYLVFAEGLGIVPKEGMFLRIGAIDYEVKAVTDVMKAGTVFYLLVSDG